MASFAGKHGQLALQARLLDMGKLFSGFKKAQEDRYVTTDETLDVLARLISMPNVIVTSHQALLTEDALDNIAQTTVRNIVDMLTTGQCVNAL